MESQWGECGAVLSALQLVDFQECGGGIGGSPAQSRADRDPLVERQVEIGGDGGGAAVFRECAAGQVLFGGFAAGDGASCEGESDSGVGGIRGDLQGVRDSIEGDEERAQLVPSILGAQCPHLQDQIDFAGVSRMGYQGGGCYGGVVICFFYACGASASSP